MNTIKSLARFFTFTECIAFVATLASCATPMPTLALTPEAVEQLHKIAVVEVKEPASYGVVNVANEARFGGGLVNMKHGEEFTKALRERGFSLSTEFNEQLVSALKSAGFEVERIQVVQKENVVTHGDTTADAILVVAVGAAYRGNDFADYVPQVRARVVLLENKPGKENPIYRENFWYGSMNPLIGGKQIDTDPTYSYGTFDKLMESNVQASEGLLKGAALIADRVAKEIASPKR